MKVGVPRLEFDRPIKALQRLGKTPQLLKNDAPAVQRRGEVVRSDCRHPVVARQGLLVSTEVL